MALHKHIYDLPSEFLAKAVILHLLVREKNRYARV